MTCRAARLKMGHYLDGELNTAESRALAAHLVSCSGCREILEEIRLAREALRRSAQSAIPVPPDLCSRIKGALLVAEEERRIVESANTPAIGSPAFIGTCASLFIGALMFYLAATQIIGRGPEPSNELPANLLASSPAAAETATVAEADVAPFTFLVAVPNATSDPEPVLAASPSSNHPSPAAVSAAGGAAGIARRASPARERTPRSRPPRLASRRNAEKTVRAPVKPPVAAKAPCFAFAESSLDGPVEQAGRRSVTPVTEPRSSAMSYASNLRRGAADLSPNVFEDYTSRRLLDPGGRLSMGSNSSLASPGFADPGEGLP